MPKNPRLDELKRDGSMIGQPPFDFGKVPPVGHKSDSNAILNTGKKKLLRRYAQQKINRLIRHGVSIPADLINLAKRPEKRKR